MTIVRWATASALVAGVGAPLALSLSSGPPQAIGPLVLSPTGDGLNHFDLQIAGTAGAPGSAGDDADPIVLPAGAPNSDYLANLDQLEGQVAVQDVYRDSSGNVRAHLSSPSPLVHQEEISSYRASMNTPGDPAVVQRLAHEPGVVRLRWITPGVVAVATTLGETQVAKLPGVLGVAPDAYSVISAPDDPNFSQQWGLANTGQRVVNQSGAIGDDANVTPAWQQTLGHGVTVAVIDTGAQSTHPDLQGIFSSASYNFVDNTTDFDPSNSADAFHGTVVTGIVAARTNNGVGIAGVAPAATILELKVSDSSTLTDSTVVQAVYYALEHGARVINMSFGSTTYDPTLEAAIQQAQADGVLVVAAAGNDGQDVDPTSADPTLNTNPNTTYPAALPEPNIVSVGASDQADAPASFSDYGASSVDLFAPGVNILSTYPGSRYQYESGTSMAVPMVSGAAALVWSRNPTLSYDKVKAALMGAVTSSPALVGKSVSSGELNAGAAVRAASAPMAVEFHGFDQLAGSAPSSASFTASLTDPTVAAPQTPVAWRLTVAVDDNGAAAAVGGLPISVSAGGITRSLVTDSSGTAVFAPPGLTVQSAASPSTVTLATDYPWQATYALAVSLVPAGTPSHPAYATQGVFFQTTSGVPLPNAAPAPTTTAPSSPTTTAPSQPSPTTTAPGQASPTTTTPSSGGSGPSEPGSATTTVPKGGGSQPSAPGSAPGTTTTSPPAPNPEAAPTTTIVPSSGGPGGGSGGGSGGSGGGDELSPPPEPPPPPPNAGPPPPPPLTDPGTGGSPPSSGGSPSSPGSSPTTTVPPSPTTTIPVSPTTTAPSSPTTTAPPSGDPGTSPSSPGDGSPPPTLAPSAVFGLRNVSPPHGWTDGGNPATVTGTSIPAGSGVEFGGEPAQVVIDHAPHMLQVVVPPHSAGTVDVVVIAPDGQRDTLPASYTYRDHTPAGGSKSDQGGDGSSPGAGSPGDDGGSGTGTGDGGSSGDQPGGSVPGSGTGTPGDGTPGGSSSGGDGGGTTLPGGGSTPPGGGSTGPGAGSGSGTGSGGGTTPPSDGGGTGAGGAPGPSDNPPPTGGPTLELAGPGGDLRGIDPNLWKLDLDTTDSAAGVSF